MYIFKCLLPSDWHGMRDTHLDFPFLTFCTTLVSVVAGGDECCVADQALSTYLPRLALFAARLSALSLLVAFACSPSGPRDLRLVSEARSIVSRRKGQRWTMRRAFDRGRRRETLSYGSSST